MTEIGERSRPPGDPPDGSASWVQKVTGSSVGGILVPETVLNDRFVTERMNVEFPNGEDGEPVITIGADVLEAMNGLWKRCMIVKVLGRHISFSVLSKKLREMWQPKGAMYVMDLPRQFFMVRFELEEEYLAALTGGPWRMFGSYLMVQAWSPEFDPLRSDIVTTPVWIRIANIPVNFYHNTILMGIAKGLGKPVRVDSTTLNFERARFARVCVEVNLTKPLKGTIMVNGERYYVSYEGLTNICSMCGLYGHLVHTCPKNVSEKVVEAPSSSVRAIVGGQSQDNDGFTEVRRRGKAPESQARSPANRVVFAAGSSNADMGRNLKEISGNIMISNRYGSLEEDTISTGLRKVVISGAGNKENDLAMIQGGKGKGVAPVKEVVEVGVGGKKQSGPKTISQGKRAGVARPMRNMEIVGLKGKQNKINRPTRGLVFGQTREEVILTESGKRLRVESGSEGRRESFLGGECVTNMVGNEPNVHLSEEMDSDLPKLDEENASSNNALVVHSGSTERGAGGSVA